MDHPPASADQTVPGLLGDLRVLIQDARGRVAHAVNAVIVYAVGRQLSWTCLKATIHIDDHVGRILQAVTGKFTLECRAIFVEENFSASARAAYWG